MESRIINQPLVVFSNPGEIDIAAVTTLGVSVKEHDSPIGLFGTGLKYSIAVLLREGLEIQLRSGKAEYAFMLKEQRIRGEDFKIVHMIERTGEETWGNIQSLHFTTAYGRNWTLENVYRELWSNMRDERGRVELTSEWELPPPAEGQTEIIVKGERFAEVHNNRWDFLLNPARQCLAATPQLEIYAPGGKAVFYRGIKALELSEPALFTYNIVEKHQLTEDRTLYGGSWQLNEMIKSLILYGENEELCEALLCAPKGKHENGFYFSSLTGAGETFKRVARKLIKTKPLELNTTAGDLFAKISKLERIEYQEIEPSAEQKVILYDALRRLESWGFPYGHFGFTIKVVADAGDNIIARVNGKSECVLTLKAIDDLDLLEHALIEEFIHMRDGVFDHTAAMQNSLFREIVRLGRKSQGEAIAFQPPAPAALDPLDDEIPF